MIRVAVVAAGLSIWAAAAFAQSSAEPVRRGGLLPSRAAEPGPVTPSREELARRWDLNADGVIDDAEAELARGKMRRERRELRERSQIDPLTGKPRGAAPGAVPAEDELVFPDPAATAPPEPSSKTKEDPRSPTRRDTTPGPSAAGAPPKRDLNAGRPLGSLPNAAGTKPLAGRLSGTAAPVPGGIRGQPQAGARTRPARPVAPSRPVPTVPSRPRVSADEIGGP